MSATVARLPKVALSYNLGYEVCEVWVDPKASREVKTGLWKYIVVGMHPTDLPRL